MTTPKQRKFAQHVCVTAPNSNQVQAGKVNQPAPATVAMGEHLEYHST